jgi:putative restriction endonuclease
MPWAENLKDACNPENGFCMNALHDKAFDRGLITISEHLKIVVSPQLLKQTEDKFINNYFIRYHNTEIIKPKRFLPKTEFLKYHFLNIFQK